MANYGWHLFKMYSRASYSRASRRLRGHAAGMPLRWKNFRGLITPFEGLKQKK
jgi:hypothetical protein